MSPGYCKGCGNRSDGSDICDRCEAFMDEDQPRRQPSFAPSNVCIPYDPDTDPF